MWTPPTLSSLLCSIALAGTLSHAAPTTRAHADSLYTPAFLTHQSVSDFSSDASFLLRRAPLVGFDYAIDPKQRTVHINGAVINLAWPTAGPAFPAACSKTEKIGAYSLKRGESHIRVGLALEADCVAEDEAEPGTGPATGELTESKPARASKVILTLRASLATIGGLPAAVEDAVPQSVLQLRLTYAPGSALPAAIHLARLGGGRAPKLDPAQGSVVIHQGGGPSSHRGTGGYGRYSPSRPFRRLVRFVRKLVVAPYRAVGHRLSTLALSLAAIGTILWAASTAVECRREGSIRLEEEPATDAQGEEMWVLAGDKV